MARPLHCDICKKATNRFVAKLFISPIGNGGKGDHQGYTGHADVGECCGHIINDIHWQKRRKYRRNGESATGNTLDKSKPAAAKS